jgi:DMSO/TMAO reductase YedYZ molybdopterin-dependent catalytic subunit
MKTDDQAAKPRGFTRRFLLKAMTIVALTVSIPKKVWSFFVDDFLDRMVEKKNFRFDPATGTIEWKGQRSKEKYFLVVEGLVENPQRFSYQDLMNLPQVTQISDFHCVEGWSVENAKWGGFRFADLANRVHPKPEARYITFHCLGKTEMLVSGVDHYRESLPLEKLFDLKQECLLALTLNGKPLSFERGSPLRVVSPFDLGYKGAKYVTRIVFAREQEPGWWTLANPIYPVNAPVAPKRLRKKH